MSPLPVVLQHTPAPEALIAETTRIAEGLLEGRVRIPQMVGKISVALKSLPTFGTRKLLQSACTARGIGVPFVIECGGKSLWTFRTLERLLPPPHRDE